MVELERLAVADVLALQARERLHRGRGQRAQELGDVRAAAHASHVVVERFRKPCRRFAPTSFEYAGSMRSQAPG